MNQKLKNAYIKRTAQLMALGMTFAAASAQAAIDVTTVISGVTDAGVAITSVITALLALSVSLFGIVKVYRFVSSKSGA